MAGETAKPKCRQNNGNWPQILNQALSTIAAIHSTRVEEFMSLVAEITLLIEEFVVPVAEFVRILTLARSRILELAISRRTCPTFRVLTNSATEPTIQNSTDDCFKVDLQPTKAVDVLRRLAGNEACSNRFSSHCSVRLLSTFDEFRPVA